MPDTREGEGEIALWCGQRVETLSDETLAWAIDHAERAYEFAMENAPKYRYVENAVDRWVGLLAERHRREWANPAAIIEITPPPRRWWQFWRGW